MRRSLCPRMGHSVSVCFGLMLILSSLFLGAVPTIAWPLHDPVLEWIGIMNDTALAAGTNPLATSRVVALVSASVYDAVNGIEPRYQPFFVKPDGSHSASQRAAAIQAAYAILIDLYPAQTYPNEAANLVAHRTASLIALAEHEKADSINAGIAWGQTVADAIWAWRLTDGNAPPPPPFVGVLGIEDKPEAIGVWRPTPKANAYGAGPQFATMTPWVLTRPSLFRLPPPLALDSPEFATDLAEVTKMGIQFDSPRTADQSDLALFWAGNTPLYWNRVAVQLATKASLSLTHNARLFALLNVTMADAAIACWDSKYRYVFWRPITAIRTGVGTQPADPTWTPWLDDLTGTPAHPEYPSGHSTVSGSAAAVLAAAFGENTSFTVTTDVKQALKQERSFNSFEDAVLEIANARVFGGIHFRISCTRGNQLGQSVAEYVTAHAFRPLDD
jgi:PAP2 superfamily